MFEIFRSYSCSPATLPNRASAGSLFTLIFLIWSAGVSLLRRINRGKYIKQRTLFISRCTNRQVQRQTITEETAIRSTTFTGKFVYADLKKKCVLALKWGGLGELNTVFLGGLMWLSNQGKYMSVQLRLIWTHGLKLVPAWAGIGIPALLAAVSSGSAVRASKLDLVEGRKFDSHLELIIFL